MKSSDLYRNFWYIAGMPLDSPADRLRKAREHAGVGTMSDACRRFSWPYETYKKHEGGTRPIGQKMAAKYGRSYGVDPGWILWGTNHPSWEEAAEPKISHHNFRCVPSITLEQAVQMPQQYSRISQSSPETTLDNSPDIGPRSFSITLDDDSMTARPLDVDNFRRGDVLVFDPDITPAPGDFVCAHVEGEPCAKVRKYRPRGVAQGKAIYDLTPLNSDYATDRIGPNDAQGRIVGVMIRHIRKYARRD